MNEQTQTRRKMSHTGESPSEARAIKHNSAVKSRGTRDERAGASPNGGPLTRLVIYNIYRLPYIKLLSRASRSSGPPQALAIVTSGKIPLTT